MDDGDNEPISVIGLELVLGNGLLFLSVASLCEVRFGRQWTKHLV